MLNNYLKTAVTYLWGHKTFTGINLIGLSIGISTCFFALLFVNFELSYDTHNEKVDQIYRLVTDVKTSTGVSYESTSAPMAPAIQEAFPDVQIATRVFLDYMVIRKDNNNFGDENIAYADPSLFSVFSLPLISGNAPTAFDAPFSLILSETAAMKYFNTIDCLGKALQIDSNYPATVTGVMKDMPDNSHFKVEIFLSMSTLLEEWNPSLEHNWNRFGFYTYLLLQENIESDQLSIQLSNFINKHIDRSNMKYTLLLEPLKSVYLQSKPRGSRYGSSVSGDINNVYIFSIIAVFVLFIACFNFINLTTAFSMQRAKEIGVRKVLGASKSQLINQFLLESVMVSVFAFIIALMMCILLLPFFNQVSGKILSTTIFEHSNYVGWLLLITIAIGFLSGIYPAFFLSRFKTLSSLKGSFITGSSGAILRKGLVITQFSISILLIIATLVVYTQLNYMQNKQLGFKKDHMLVVDFYFDGRIYDHEEAIKQQLASIPGIDLISLSSSIPGRANRTFLTEIENVDNKMQDFISDVYFVDYDFIDLYQIEVIAGRGFSKNFESDLGRAMVINEAAAKSLGYYNLDDAIGKRFTQKGKNGIIIGVIKDFHYHSYREMVRPLTLRVVPHWFTFITLNVTSDNLQTTISSLENKWKKLIPDKAFNYFFMDEAYNAQYIAEARFGKLFMGSTLLAIFISCLGIFGLSAFTTLQRTKEIGVRKVLGASIQEVVSLLAKDYLLLIGIAFVIGTLLAWFAMNTWLDNFAYRINLSWWIFVFAGISAMLLALVTISFQTIKAARVNPVNSLRIE